MFTIAFIHPPMYHFSEVVSIRRVHDVSRIEHLFALRVRATNGDKIIQCLRGHELGQPTVS